MYKTEFPDFKLDVSIPAGFVDNSWHNNVMPCWVRELPDEKIMVLWIDYADPALRDYPHNVRFVLHLMDSSMTDVEESFASNDLHEILEQLTDFFPFINCTYDELMKTKNDLWSRVPDDDHARSFKEWDSVAAIDDEILARSLTVETF
jgi:hypothetical protein